VFDSVCVFVCPHDKAKTVETKNRQTWHRDSLSRYIALHDYITFTLHKKLFRVAYSLKTSEPLNGAQMNQS